MEPNNLGTLVIQLERYKENKVIRNSFYGVVQFILPAVFLLVFTPFFILKMGTARYGLWMLATSALGLMGIAEFGLNTMVSKFVAEFVETKDTVALSEVVSIGLIAYLLLGFGLIVPLYVFSPSLAGIFKPSEAVSVDEIGLVIRIISLGFIPLLLRSGAMAIPIGLQQFQIPVAVNVGNQILSYIAGLLVVLLGGTITQVVMSTVVVLWVAALGSLLIAWRILQPLKLKFRVACSIKFLRRMSSFTLMSGISGLGSQIFGFADRLAVGVVLGMDAVAYYTVIISVATKILQLSSSLTGALMPAVSSWVACGDIRRVRGYFFNAIMVLFALDFVIASVMLSISRTLLYWWMGDAFTAHVLVQFRILIVIYCLISLNTPAFFVAYGIGRPGINALTAVLGGCLTVGLIFMWGETFGLLGAAIANSGYLITLVITGYVYWRVNSMGRQRPLAHRSNS